MDKLKSMKIMNIYLLLSILGEVDPYRGHVE